MTLRLAHISDIHVARQPVEKAEADVEYLRSYLARVLPVAGAVGGASFLARFAWKRLDDKEFLRRYAGLMEQLRGAGEKLDTKTVIGLVMGLFGVSMGFAFVYRRELMKLLSALQYRERRELRKLLLESLSEECPDVILVTGDLTTVASEEEFYEAKNFLDSMVKLECNPIVLIIPGNHDIEDAAKGEKHARLDTYATVFSDYLPRSVVPLKADLGDLVIFGINSNTVGRGLGTDGRVGSKSMEFLKKELAADKNKSKIVGVHHHLAKYGREVRVPPMENANEFLKTAHEGGVSLICHGHKHDLYTWRYNGEPERANESAGKKTIQEGAITIACAGASTEATTWRPKKLRYRVFEFDNGRMVASEGVTITKEVLIAKSRKNEKPDKAKAGRPDGLPMVDETFIDVAVEVKRSEGLKKAEKVEVVEVGRKRSKRKKADNKQ